MSCFKAHFVAGILDGALGRKSFCIVLEASFQILQVKAFLASASRPGPQLLPYHRILAKGRIIPPQ
jgi:hypothetical protein